MAFSKMLYAKDVMTAGAVSIAPESSLVEAARSLLDYDVGSLLVIDKDGKLVGIVTESDLLHRQQAGVEHKVAWYKGLFQEADQSADDYIKAHGHLVRDVMSRTVVTLAEDEPVPKILHLLEEHDLRQAPVVRDGKPVGVVARTNLLQMLILGEERDHVAIGNDRELRDSIVKEIADNHLTSGADVRVEVVSGKAKLTGIISSDIQRDALMLAAQEAGAEVVTDRMQVMARGIISGV